MGFIYTKAGSGIGIWNRFLNSGILNCDLNAGFEIVFNNLGSGIEIRDLFGKSGIWDWDSFIQNPGSSIADPCSKLTLDGKLSKTFDSGSAEVSVGQYGTNTYIFLTIKYNYI